MKEKAQGLMNYESHYGTVISPAMPQRVMTPPPKSGKTSITLSSYWNLVMVKVGYELYPWSTLGNISLHLNVSIGQDPARLFPSKCQGLLLALKT